LGVLGEQRFANAEWVHDCAHFTMILPVIFGCTEQKYS